jgi:hypothetical protein
MPRSFVRRDFVIKDLAVSIGSGGRGGSWMPGPDDETPPTPISPIAAVLTNLAHIEAVRGTIADAVKTQRYDEIARAFVPGEAGGNAAIRSAIFEIGSAVVSSAAFAALGGGSAGMPNPDCGGSSYETIPPTLTPVVHIGFAVHRVTELPRLRQQLANATAYVEKASAAQAPRSKEEVGAVRKQLEEALTSLPR